MTTIKLTRMIDLQIEKKCDDFGLNRMECYGYKKLQTENSSSISKFFYGIFVKLILFMYKP